MTCQELHDYWQSDPRVEINLRSNSAELAEHIASCRECHRLIEEQKEVAKYLHGMRDSAPAVQASLDGAVLASYRRYLAERSRSAAPVPLRRRISPRGALGWAAAVAFAVVVAYGGMLLLIPRQRGWVDRQVTARQPMVAPQTAPAANAGTPVAHKFARKKPKAVVASVKRTKHQPSVTEQDATFSTRFQSLMYCDQISCPGAMEVIRVQLPSPILGVTPASARANGVVSADVLVGPDGIARGIRVVE